MHPAKTSGGAARRAAKETAPARPYETEAEPLLDAANGQSIPPAGISIAPVSHHGWSGSWLISNGIVEVDVVPEIGRVMQFRLVGDADGTFWQNRALDGRQQSTSGGDWLNFGGDKCWPSPQSSWPIQQGGAWPPPGGFDGCPMGTTLTERGVVLTSAIDPFWGIQVVRHIELEPDQPVLHVRTVYRKLQGPPVRTGIWTITQFQDPEQTCMLLAPASIFQNGFVNLLDVAPANFEMHDFGIDGQVLSFARHGEAYTKIGSDGISVAWIGRKCMVRIDVEPVPGEHPDGGCRTEIYTNPDPLKYVELETLGPLTAMEPGGCIEQSARYTILRRTESEARARVRQIFATSLG